MFGRRQPLTTLHKLRELLWPKQGWHRAARYLGHRLARMEGSSYSIAAGFACGAAISFTPFVGFHFVCAALISALIGGHIFAAALGTAVGNPWTFPIIWWWIFKVGRWVLGDGDTGEIPDDFSFHYILEHPWGVLWPMVIGSVPTALVVWLGSFWFVRKAIDGYQRARRIRRLRRMKRRGSRLGRVVSAAKQSIRRDQEARS